MLVRCVQWLAFEIMERGKMVTVKRGNSGFYTCRRNGVILCLCAGKAAADEIAAALNAKEAPATDTQQAKD